MVERKVADIDPRLEAAIRQVGETGEVEAMVTLSKSRTQDSDARGVGGRVVDRITESLHEEPKRVRYMPKLGTVYIRGSGRLIRELLKQEEVKTATALIEQ
jgi:hypothetical protein